MGFALSPLCAAVSLGAFVSIFACQSADPPVPTPPGQTVRLVGSPTLVTLDGKVGMDLAVSIPVTGRYRVTINGKAATPSTVWIEDYIHNTDGRTYDITGPLELAASGVVTVDGSPLQEGDHQMRVHSSEPATVQAISFELLRRHTDTPIVLQQEVAGDGPWKVVWADEFDEQGPVDPSKWTSDLGNWGWGNREPQYYTEGETDNARQEAGNLVIEAHPNVDGHAWTSARLTTRGKVGFLYGRIEIRAKVPSTDGTWAAGWLLGDDYRDEISWPYCGEIDVMEAVGKEIDDETTDGINHGSCHTREFYFKQGNHISEVHPVKDMQGTFHVYAVEWTPEEVRLYVDDVHYYTYNQHGTPEAWPFDRPQNLILNLAMGGGMGGEIAPDAGVQRIVVDYVRVLGR
jgi:beta-glucanase (GH16 family)